MKITKKQLVKLIDEQITVSGIKLDEALKFPAGKFDDQYKKLITAAQKQPKWDYKPNVNRTTATHTINGEIDGKEYFFAWNWPGSFGPCYIFKGLNGPNFSYLDDSTKSFNKSGEEIDKVLYQEIFHIAKEKSLSTRTPFVWLLAAKNIPDELIKANIKEFTQAIKSIS